MNRPILVSLGAGVHLAYLLDELAGRNLAPHNVCRLRLLGPFAFHEWAMGKAVELACGVAVDLA